MQIRSTSFAEGAMGGGENSLGGKKMGHCAHIIRISIIWYASAAGHQQVVGKWAIVTGQQSPYWPGLHHWKILSSWVTKLHKDFLIWNPPFLMENSALKLYARSSCENKALSKVAISKIRLCVFSWPKMLKSSSGGWEYGGVNFNQTHHREHLCP